VRLAMLERFCKVKGLPRPGRVSGGMRTIHYQHPERVEVIRGRKIERPGR